MYMTLYKFTFTLPSVSLRGSTARLPCLPVCLYLVTEVLCSSLLPFLRSMCVYAADNEINAVDLGLKRDEFFRSNECQRTANRIKIQNYIIRN